MKIVVIGGTGRIGSKVVEMLKAHGHPGRGLVERGIIEESSEGDQRFWPEGGGDLQADNPGVRNLHFGVREHAMAAIVNGLSLSKLRPFGATSCNCGTSPLF